MFKFAWIESEDARSFAVSACSIGSFDQFSILLERSGQVQLVYKHAVSTLQPAGSLDLQSHGDDEPAGDGS